MNAFNRVLIVFLLVVAIALCSVLLVVPADVFNVVAQQSAYLANLFEFDRFSHEWFVQTLTGVSFALILDIILLFFIFLELRRPRKSIRVEKAGGGEVLISIASIADRMKHEVNQLPNILRTKPKVSSKRKGVGVELDVESEPGINVPEKAEQIVEMARRVVEEDMGLKLAQPPKVNLRVVSYSKAGISPIKPREVILATPKAPPPPIEPVEAEA